MTFNEFNSKINLPEVCRNLGIKGFQFTKLPRFGWFAHSADLTQIFHIFQLFPDDEVLKLFKKYTVQDTSVQDFVMIYSETSEEKLYRDYERIRYYRNLFRDSQQEAEITKIFHNNRNMWLRDLLEESGFPKLLETSVGLVTDRILDKYSRTEWPDDAKHKIIVPSFATPLHACSYDLVYPGSLKLRRNLFTNGEAGWYGTINKSIVANLREIGSTEGCTWDSKADSWMTHPVGLSLNLEPNECIKIWSEAKRTLFTNSPLEVIKAKKNEELLKLHCKSLTRTQVKEAEKYLGITLIADWERQQEAEVQIGGMRFVSRNNKYFMYSLKHDYHTEYTNFAMKIERIIKSGQSFYRMGVIKYDDKEVPFIIEEKNFSNIKKLMNVLHSFFFNHGLGIPIVLSNHKTILLDVINKFNQNVPIETCLKLPELEAKEKTEPVA